MRHGLGRVHQALMRSMRAAAACPTKEAPVNPRFLGGLNSGPSVRPFLHVPVPTYDQFIEPVLRSLV